MVVCSTAVLSASLALSLLRHSSPGNESFVLSPFSLNSALAILHDGAGGETKKELTNLLLNGCTSDDVTNFYSSLIHSLPTDNATGVSFKSANRFFVDNSISLKTEYQKHVEDKFGVKVSNINLGDKTEAAKVMNEFVDDATNGKIKDIVNPDGIADDAKSVLINALHFFGKWKFPFEQPHTYTSFDFTSDKNNREACNALDCTVEMMVRYTVYKPTFGVNRKNDVGTVLLMPYEDETYTFFIVMPNATSSVEKTRNSLTGEKLISILQNKENFEGVVRLPKFNVTSQLDGVKVLSELNVNKLFGVGADLSGITDTPLKISQVQHNAVIQVDEAGTEAAAVTKKQGVNKMAGDEIQIYQSFLFGIKRNDDILFLGQYV